jgi:hypothetical protein
MSAKVWCQFANGKEHEGLRPTKDEAVHFLTNILETWRGKGNKVSEQFPAEGSSPLYSPLYIVKDTDGRMVVKYQIKE